MKYVDNKCKCWVTPCQVSWVITYFAILIWMTWQKSTKYKILQWMCMMYVLKCWYCFWFWWGLHFFNLEHTSSAISSSGSEVCFIEPIILSNDICIEVHMFKIHWGNLSTCLRLIEVIYPKWTTFLSSLHNFALSTFGVSIVLLAYSSIYPGVPTNVSPRQTHISLCII